MREDQEARGTGRASEEKRAGRPIRVLGVRSRDDDDLSRSASGSAFTILARPVFAQGGIVFGSAWDKECRAVHIGVDNEIDMRMLQGSKYVQSDVFGAFPLVSTALRDERLVLFTGAPCQISALYSYLAARDPGVQRDTLVTCDLICHGVTSPKLFEMYLEWLERKRKADAPITDLAFRAKRYGWGLYYYYYYWRNGRRHGIGGIANDDPYYAAFLKGDLYRDACYTCPHASIDRTGDFTIGDYWGIGQAHPSFADDRGTSAVLVNSEKANHFFDENCMDECEWIESDIELVCAGNSNLLSPTKMSSTGEALRQRVAAAIADHDVDSLFETVLKPKTGVKGLVRRVVPLSMILKARNTVKGRADE